MYLAPPSTDTVIEVSKRDVQTYKRCNTRFSNWGHWRSVSQRNQNPLSWNRQVQSVRGWRASMDFPIRPTQTPLRSKRDIWKFLHPTLEEEYIPIDEKVFYRTDEGTIERKPKTIKISPGWQFYSWFKEFQNMPKFNLEVPIIHGGHPYASPLTVH